MSEKFAGDAILTNNTGYVPVTRFLGNDAELSSSIDDDYEVNL